MNSLEKIGFGGGCHWCTEAVFQALSGVRNIRQGFIRSTSPDDSWSEAVEVDFNPEEISLSDLLTVHLATHASTSKHSMRDKYRSAVYTYSPEQSAMVTTELDRISVATDTEFVTRVLPHHAFKFSEARFHNYYATDPERPFCRTYIDSKMAKLQTQFSRIMKA
jgi:peptide-methionine (S)-S-oxide reductase